MTLSESKPHIQFKITTSQVPLIEDLILNKLCVAHEKLGCIVTPTSIEIGYRCTTSQEVLTLLNSLQMLEVDLRIVSIRCDI
jgi:hypothetical protein